MASFSTELSNLLAAVNGLNDQVMALLGDADQRILAKIHAADIQALVVQLVQSGDIAVTINPTDLATIIAAKIASGDLGTQATTLGGHDAAYFAKASDLATLAQVVANTTSGLPANTVIDMGELP